LEIIETIKTINEFTDCQKETEIDSGEKNKKIKKITPF
jgi:hypothetical protein